jgi:hypothetical protein
MDTRKCASCKITKPISEFRRRTCGSYYSYCRPCNTRLRNLQRYRDGDRVPLNQAKDCASYLGVYIAEKILEKFFDNTTRMPYGNPGYDYVCDKGYKIDVKSSCLRNLHFWQFHIERNEMADYFLCLAFNNREDLTPLHVWLIPGNIINDKTTISIINSCKSLNKWKQYERSLDRVIECCNTMKHDP